MENNRLKLVKSYIGKAFTGSPSPFAHWLNGTILAVSEKSVMVQFTVRKDMTNPVGMLHGGVISGMIDDCLGITFFTLGLDNFYPTINLYVEFFHPASEGETVMVRTDVIKQGKTIINMRAELLNSDQKLLAQANSNLVLSNIKIQI